MTSTPCPRCEALEALLREVRPYLNRYKQDSFLGELYTQQVAPTGVLGEIAQRIDAAVPAAGCDITRCA